MNYLMFTLIAVLSFFTYGANFIKGADISWVPGQESRGITFKDTLGKQRDILDILKNDYQINSIRLRVFVNPSDDWGNGLCDIASTVSMAKRIKNADLQLILTLHYSDSWADPGKQYPPVAWENFSAAQLEEAIYNHTKEIMEALETEDVYPVMVQIGNETNDGMLWENGRASKNMGNYARFITAGNNAVKEISPETKTVVHLSNGFDNSLFRWNIGGLIDNNAKFDVIGISAYPEYAPNTSAKDWKSFNSKVYSNIVDMIKLYEKPVIIAETGMHYKEETNCRDMIADMISRVRALDDHMGLGIIYWEPQAGPGYNRGYNLGAWGDNGQPTKALNGFIEDVTSIKNTSKEAYKLMQNIANTFTLHGISNSTLPDDFSGSSFAVYSTSGRMIYKNIYSKQMHCELPNGTYFMKVKNCRTQLRGKLLIIN
jgi:arabinogalactan endo-1,4-beta-galactosidase